VVALWRRAGELLWQSRPDITTSGKKDHRLVWLPFVVPSARVAEIHDMKTAGPALGPLSIRQAPIEGNPLAHGGRYRHRWYLKEATSQRRFNAQLESAEAAVVPWWYVGEAAQNRTCQSG